MRFQYYIFKGIRIIVRHLWYYPNTLSAFYWGINVSKCKFHGRTRFTKHPDSEITIGNNCTFNSSFRSNLIGVYSPCMFSTLKTNAKLSIGSNCGFSGTCIGAALDITIGNGVRCGANTLITDTDWHSEDYRVGPDQPVTIEDNVWLGYGVKVLKGVTIGKNSIIGAGSIVVKSIPQNVVAAGNPCRVIRNLPL